MKNKYEIRGDITAIFVYTKGSYIETIIDTADLPKAQSIKGTWSYMQDYSGREYIRHSVDRSTTLYLHHLICPTPEGFVADHLNRNSLDNRRCNLIVSTHTDNMRNKGARKDSPIGIPGVSKHKSSNRYRARVRVHGVEHSLGTFDTPYEAGRAVNEFKIRSGIRPFRQTIKLG